MPERGPPPQALFKHISPAVFALIDTDGGGTLSKEEFQHWFEMSDLMGLMSFKEFYRPIARLDRSSDGQTDPQEFVVAMTSFHRYLQNLFLHKRSSCRDSTAVLLMLLCGPRVGCPRCRAA